MNYPWNELGIEVTDDKKVIKKAYAKLIRKYRPDEAPEKFQEINQAYQYALGLIKHGVVEEDAPSVNHDYPSQRVEELSDDEQHEVAASIEITGETVDQAEKPAENTEPNVATTENDEEDNPELDIANDILEQFHQMAFADYKSKKKAENWTFLERYHEIQDLQLRDSLSKELFKRVAEYNFFQLKENKTQLLSQEVIKVIADIMDWGGQWQAFHGDFPEAYVEHVFKQLEPQTELSSLSFLMLRAGAIVLELLIAYGIAKMIGLRPWAITPDSVELVTVFVFVVFNTVSMCSELNLPILQFMVDLRIYDKFLNVPELDVKAKRALVFHMSMLPLYLFIYNPNYFLSFVAWSGGLLIIVNAICWFKSKQLFHDWVSGTIMLK